MKGSATYYARLLRTLASGEWASAAELAHPVFPQRGFEATMRLLLAQGYDLEQDGNGDGARFRSSRQPFPPHGRTVRLRRDLEGRRAGEEGMILVHDDAEGTDLVMFLDGTAASIPAGELDYGDSDEPAVRRA